jgi:CRISPR/Cas system-associated protein Cas5 (RAMP superfamily)
MSFKAKVKIKKAKVKTGHRLTFAFLIFTFALLSGCAVDQRRNGLPTGAQNVIDELTEEIASGSFGKIYADAADEWRATVSAEESEKILARVRDKLGRVQSRVPVRATEQGIAGGASQHTLSVSYNTKFERADALESFTLVERDGRWHLSRYSVNSDALKP